LRRDAHFDDKKLDEQSPMEVDGLRCSQLEGRDGLGAVAETHHGFRADFTVAPEWRLTITWLFHGTV